MYFLSQMLLSIATNICLIQTGCWTTSVKYLTERSNHKRLHLQHVDCGTSHTKILLLKT